jgi:hypothetical protein
MITNYQSDAIFIPIATINANTNACINTESNHCTYVIRGIAIGKFIPKAPTVAAPNHKNATLSKIDHEDILPNSLRDNDIIRANTPMISNIPINIDIIISQILLSGISHLPVIGIYSWRSLRGHQTLLP